MTCNTMQNESYTAEDFEIWLTVVRASAMPAQLWVLSEIQNYRDASLMLELTELRAIEAYGDVRALQIMAGQDGCSVGGWMGHYRWVSDCWSNGTKLHATPEHPK